MPSLTLLYYQLCEQFNDDERLVAFFISEENAEKIYKDLLRGKFDKYAKMLEEKLSEFEGDLTIWIDETLFKFDFSRNELFVHTDFENIGDKE